jgi:histone acetyltransferase (RNA polymerase elongator complex component)
VGTALVRELHVYGQMTALDDDDTSDTPRIQHTGIGTICLQMAESIAKQKSYPRISVIA